MVCRVLPYWIGGDLSFSSLEILTLISDSSVCYQILLSSTVTLAQTEDTGRPKYQADFARFLTQNSHKKQQTMEKLCQITNL